jgi:predicted TPR repeat methyltransferase
MVTYFDQYSNQYKQMLAASTGTNVESAGFFASQKIHHLRRSLPVGFDVKSILDYGCGIGMSLMPLRQAFPKARIVGVDPSEASLQVAADQHKDHDIELMSLSTFQRQQHEDLFDLIFLSCVLHHIDENEHKEVLGLLNARCSTGGRIAIVEHNPSNPYTRKIVRDCPFDEGVKLIPSRYLKRLLMSSGWQKPNSKYITFIPPSLRRISMMEDWLAWCPAGGQYLLMAQSI